MQPASYLIALTAPLAALFSGALLAAGSPSASAAEPAQTAAAASATVCSATTGAPPIRTDEPTSIPLVCLQGKLLSFHQNGVTRYACLSAPAAAGRTSDGRRWPLLVYLHGSITTPESLYLEGKNLFALHDTYNLSDDPQVKGFYILAPEGRRATPWPAQGGNGPVTGSGFHWDEWYRNASGNLDALAVDHFLDETVATGRIDPKRIYVFGWSNGAYMTMLYANWRSDRIAASAQYAGADPWSRTPCPVAVQATRKVPLVLLRNLCDALVPCPTTASWVSTLQGLGWPFEFHNLDTAGAITAETACASSCSKEHGIFDHVRFPDTAALRTMLAFLKQHPLP